MAHHQLDELDEKILKLIIGNARMLYQKKTGMSASSPVGFLTVILMWSILQLIRRPVMEE